MKKMLLATALQPAYYRICAQQTLLFKTGSSTKGNHHPSFLRFWNWAENCQCEICGGAENVVKTETQQTFSKWIARFQ